MATARDFGRPPLKEIYEGLNIGDVLKLGIKRGKEMLIASLAKADPMICRSNHDVKRREESGDVARSWQVSDSF